MKKAFSTYWVLVALGLMASCQSRNGPQSPPGDVAHSNASPRVSRVKLRVIKPSVQSDNNGSHAAEPAKELALSEQVEVCSDCHPDAVDGFLETGMGQSFRRIETIKIIEKFEVGRNIVTHEESGLTYRAYRDEHGHWWQEETLEGRKFKRRVQVKYVVGSGNHGRTYLGEQGGEIVELPLTWYSQKGVWDLSPSYKTGNMRFGRHIRPRCLFCHNDFTPWREGTIGGYTQTLADGMSCSRCHGDAEAHVRMRTAGNGPPKGQPDPTILNPARLSAKRQRQVCQQCHLVGEARTLIGAHRWDAYDVRMPLDEYISIFVSAGPQGAEFGIASHGYRLSQSACSKDGRLTCSTCHNVHKHNTRSDYRAACLSCHSEEACGDGQGRAHNGDCAQCHMKRGGTDDTPHVSFTDHYIRKNPKADKPQSQAENQWRITNGLAQSGGQELDAQLYQGLAHFGLFMSGRSEEERRVHGERGVSSLNEALKSQPDNGRAHSALGRIYEERGQSAQAQPHYAAAIKNDPTDPLLRMYAGKIARKLNDLPSSITHYQVATRIRPDFLEAWVELGRVLAQSGQLDKATKALNKAEELSPKHAPTAINLGLAAQKAGRSKEARTWFQEAIKRDPVNMMGHLNLCMLEFAVRNVTGALSCADESLKLHSGFADGYWIRGRAQFLLGRLNEARRDLQRFVELEPMREDGHLDLARVERAAGNMDRSREILMQAQKKLGKTQRIKHALGGLQQQ